MLCEQLILGGRGNGWVLDSPAFRLQPSSALTAPCCNQRVACAVKDTDFRKPRVRNRSPRMLTS